MLTIRETAAELGLSDRTIRSWVAQQRITYAKLGRAVRIPETEVDRLTRENLVKAQPVDRRN